MSLPPLEFRLSRCPAPDGAVRLSVSGDIDIATAGQLRAALEALRQRHTAVRLDLSEVGFVDSSGLAVLITARRQAQLTGWSFEIDRRLAQPVEELFRLAGVESFIWR